MAICVMYAKLKWLLLLGLKLCCLCPMQNAKLYGLEYYVCLLAFIMHDRIDIPQAQRITAVALHLEVFQGIVFFLREALW